MNIFKQLYMEREKVDNALASVTYQTEEEHDLLLSKKEALQEIYDYLHTYNWLAHEKYKEKVKMFIKTNFKYRDCAEYFGVIQNTFETSMGYAGKKFKSKIGEKTIDLIANGDVEDGLLQFRIGIGKIALSKIVPTEIYTKLPPSKNDILMSIADCTDELELLRRMTIKSILNNMKSLSKRKMAYLRYILDTTDERHADKRGLIISYMIGNIDTVEELLMELENKKSSSKN